MSLYQNFYYDHYEVGKVIVALHKDFANQIAIRDIRSVLDELNYEKPRLYFTWRGQKIKATLEISY